MKLFIFLIWFLWSIIISYRLPTLKDREKKGSAGVKNKADLSEASINERVKWTFT